jgi:hypothetical protein
MFQNKRIFKKGEDIHIGNNAPEGFVEASIGEVEEVLKNLGKRKLWRCHVCNDLHIGISFPSPCPTCFVEDAYIEIEINEVKNLLEIK